MALIYITGVAGSGKSAVQQALQQRGYAAYDVDDPAIGGAHNLRTGQVVAIPPSEQRSPDWFSEHSWKIFIPALERLKLQAGMQPVFLCGTAANQSEMRSFFDIVLCLRIDEATLRQRLAAREGNDFGKSEHELQMTLERQKQAEMAAAELGAVDIDATQPIDAVISDIMRVIGIS